MFGSGVVMRSKPEKKALFWQASWRQPFCLCVYQPDGEDDDQAAVADEDDADEEEQEEQDAYDYDEHENGSISPT